MFQYVGTEQYVRIPNGVKEIGMRALEDNVDTVIVAVADGCEILHHGAFDGCWCLEKIIIPSSVRDIASVMFRDKQAC